MFVRGVRVRTLDSEPSYRGSNPRETSPNQVPLLAVATRAPYVAIFRSRVCSLNYA